MSQTPSNQRRVPVHILDDLSSKFLINLVSEILLESFLFASKVFFLTRCVFVFVFS